MCAVHGPFARCRCEYAIGLAAFVLGSALSLGCLPAKAPDVDPCAAEIVKLEGERDAEVAVACAGQTFDACLAVATIDRKYDPLIQKQIECKP